MKFLTVAVLICFTIVNSSNNNNYNINRDSNSISNSRLFPSIGSPIDNKKDSVSVTNNNNNKPKGLLSNDAKETIVVSLIQGLISYGFLYLSMKLVFRAISTFGDAINDIIHKDSKNNNNNNSSNSVNKYLKPNCTLSIHESEILSTVIDPKNIELTMDDIGGLDTLKSSLMDLTLLTKEMSDIASVVTPVRSVLLYGKWKFIY